MREGRWGESGCYATHRLQGRIGARTRLKNIMSSQKGCMQKFFSGDGGGGGERELISLYYSSTQNFI